MMDISTVLKLAKLAVDKYAQQSTSPGFKTTQNGREIKVSFKELSELLQELSEKDVVIVRRCKDCDNWYSAPGKRNGHCFSKTYDKQRAEQDFCSKEYIVRTPERRRIDEAVHRLSQKKRT